jgi:hypothetical protein
MNYQGRSYTVDRWIANVSSCIDFYGIDKLINTGYYNCSNWDYWFINAQFSLNKIAAGYTKRKYATINGFKQQEN